MMPGAVIIHFAARLPWPVTALAICALFAVVGAAVVDDYGVSWDELTQRSIAVANASYISGNENALQHDQFHRHYGMAFELPLLWVEYGLGLEDLRSTLLSRHLLTHFFYLVGGFFASLLTWRLFGSKWLALLALLLFLLHPRLYAHSFFNSKDVPTLCMFMITLYLTHRAWRKDTVAAFLLCGIGVGLLMNLRLVGAMLFPAVLALRVLDLAVPPRRPGHIVLTGGVFLLAGAGTMYATTPYLWANPLALADAFGAFSSFTKSSFHLFQGQLLRAEQLPAHYLPTWIAITTPPGILLLSAIGAAGICGWAITRPGAVLRSKRLRFGGFLLVGLAGPIVAVPALGITLYDGWRHMYLLYAPLCLLALFGLWWAAAWALRGGGRWGPWARAGVIGLAALGVCGTAVHMAKLHPHQDVYFNFLVDRKTPEYLRTQYEMAYWGTTTREAMESLLARYPDADIHFATYEDHDWRNWSILPPGDRRRIYPANVPYDDFYVNFGREHVHTGQLWNPVGPIIASRQVYNNTIWSVETRSEATAAAPRAAWLRTYRSITAATAAADSYFDLYRDGRQLHYVKEPCVPADLGETFFLHIYPADPDELSEGRRQFGYDNRDFIFHWAGGDVLDRKCLATVELPDYAVARIRTGQSRLWEAELPAGRNRIWSVETRPGSEADAARVAWLRTYQSITAAAPAARSNFDLYRGGNNLHYVREPCVPADLAAAFFLHIYPAAPDELSERRRQFGFDNRDFRFYEFGDLVDGKCLATVELPDYAAARIITGQYVDDQPRLWEAELPAAG